MQKRVTFVEQLEMENVLTKGRGHVSTRSMDPERGGLESLPRHLGRETHVDMSPSNQRMKTSHIPQTLMSVPFLQHPALATGRRRHLCSIANVYSTEHMRQQMKRHYLNVLHTYIQSRQNPSCRRFLDHPLKVRLERDVGKVKPERQQRSSSSGTAYSVKQTETKSCVFHLRREKEHPRV